VIRRAELLLRRFGDMVHRPVVRSSRLLQAQAMVTMQRQAQELPASPIRAFIGHQQSIQWRKYEEQDANPESLPPIACVVLMFTDQSCILTSLLCKGTEADTELTGFPLQQSS